MTRALVGIVVVLLCGCADFRRAPDLPNIVLEHTFGESKPTTNTWRLEGNLMRAGQIKWSNSRGRYFDPDFVAILEDAEVAAIMNATARIPVSRSLSRVVVAYPSGSTRAGKEEFSVRVEFKSSSESITSELPLREFMPLVEAMNRCLDERYRITWHPTSYPYTIQKIEPNQPTEPTAKAAAHQ